MTSLLIFDLGGGFNDMIKTLLCIIEFTTKNKYNFSIRYCTCRPQNKRKPVCESVRLNNYKYEVTNLFDEKSFLIYDNYISYNKINKNITKKNSYDFYTDKILNNIFDETKKDYMNNISQNILNIFNNCDKEFVIIGSGFCFYSQCNSMWNKSFYDTLIPVQKIIDEYNNIKSEISEPYNFIHYRYEEDMINYAIKQSGEYYTPILDELLDANLFKNNSYKIYIATSEIQQLHKKKLINKEIDLYENIFYKKNSNLEYFDENAWVDFKIGLESEEIIGFKYSGFSYTLNKLKGTQNYYN